MASTGEVACFGPTHHDAFLKAMMSTGMRMPQKNILVSIQEQLRDERTLPTLQKLSGLGFSLFATEKTAEYLREKVRRVVTKTGLALTSYPLPLTMHHPLPCHPPLTTPTSHAAPRSY